MGPLRTCAAPTDSPEFIRVEAPKARRKIVLLGPPWGIQTHYVAGGSKPCLAALPAGCPEEWHSRRLVWVGYTPSVMVTPEYGRDGSMRVVWAKSLVILTAKLYRWLSQETGGAAGWHGLQIEREDGVRWKPCVRLVGAELARLPPAFDPEPVLYRLWGLSHLLKPAQEPERELPPIAGKIG